MRFLSWEYWRGWVVSDPECSCEAELAQGELQHPTMSLTQPQIEALNEFQKRVSPLLPVDSQQDQDLLAWLIARDYNVDKAELMLKKHLKWRQEWSVDDILEWEAPEVLKKYYPVGLAGHDKEGCPVWIIPFGDCDIRGLLQSASKTDYIRYTIQVLEMSKADMAEQSKKLGHRISEQICIFDLENFSLKQITWKPALDTVLQLVQIYEANYPEMLKRAVAINAPKIFMVAYAMIKPFLHEKTMSKIHIHGRTGWQQELLQEIASEELPHHWGGKQVDVDGNPKCASKICLGQEVPKSYYLKYKESKQKLPSDHLQTLTVQKGGEKRLCYNVTEPGTVLKWKFQTDDYDVGFGVSWQSEDAKEELLPVQRVNSQSLDKEGSLVCTQTGTYVVTFDNTYSFIRTKTVHYSIELLPA